MSSGAALPIVSHSSDILRLSAKYLKNLSAASSPVKPASENTASHSRPVATMSVKCGAMTVKSLRSLDETKSIHCSQSVGI